MYKWKKITNAFIALYHVGASIYILQHWWKLELAIFLKWIGIVFVSIKTYVHFVCIGYKPMFFAKLHVSL